MIIGKEPSYKYSECSLEKFLKKYDKKFNSRQWKRRIDKKWKQYDNKDDIEKENYIKAYLKDIKQRRNYLTLELTEKYRNQGKNVDHVHVKKGIRIQVNKQLTEYYGFNPDTIPKTKEASKLFLFPEFDKQVDKKQDTWLFDIPDDELDAIRKLQKHDAVKYISTLEKLEQFRKDKHNGRIGLIQNQYGEYQ